MIFIAHRGAPMYAPENTIASFQYALERGMKYFETDVHLSADGIAVICHDENLKRTAGADIFIKDVSYSEILKYNKNIPRLEDLLALLKNKILNIELKTDVFEYPGIEEKVLSIINAAGARENVIISSFNPRTLIKVRELDPQIKIGYLTKKFNQDDAQKIAPVNLHINFRRLDAGTLKQARAMNLNVWTYTVNTPQDLALAVKNGAGGVFTDNPFLVE